MVRTLEARRPFLVYAVASGLAVVAIEATRLLWPVIAPTSSPLFLAAVVVSTWYGGFGPGLLTTTLATVAKAYLFMVPTHSLRIDDGAAVVRLALFVGIALLISSLTGALRRAHTENARLMGQERAARGEAEAASRAKDVFLATVSHELRTPLQAMSSWLDVLRRRHARGEDIREALQAIERSLASQARLINDLLDVSRIAAGTLRLEASPVELAPMIEAAIATARAAAPDGGAMLRVDLDPAAGAVMGDRARLEQVICNLVANALKFTPAGGRVDVRLRRAGDTVRLTVSDTGCGIPADLLPHVFDEFRQGRHSTPSPGAGLGLGLAIVRRLVEVHGGHVSARSDGPGRGAMFVVDLPAVGRCASALEEATPATGRALNRGRLSPTKCPWASWW